MITRKLCKVHENWLKKKVEYHSMNMITIDDNNNNDNNVNL